MSQRSKQAALRSCFSNQAVIKLKLGFIPRLQTSAVQSPLLQGHVEGGAVGVERVGGCLFFCLGAFLTHPDPQIMGFSGILN